MMIRLDRAPSAGCAPARSGSSARRVLVVDDHEDTVESLSDLLAMHGHHVSAYRDGLSALAGANRWRPHVAILDLGLPDMDGWTLARQIRAETWGREILLIAMTGWAGEEYRRRSIEAGFDRYFIKPASLDALFAAIECAAAGPTTDVAPEAAGCGGEDSSTFAFANRFDVS
jgi:DNA-binding response OmpR family regulator